MDYFAVLVILYICAVDSKERSRPCLFVVWHLERFESVSNFTDKEKRVVTVKTCNEKKVPSLHFVS